MHVWDIKTFNSRKGQRTNQKYGNLVGSDQQMQRLEETELRKADRTFSNISSGTTSKYITVNSNRTVSLSEFSFFKRSGLLVVSRRKIMFAMSCNKSFIELLVSILVGY